MKEYDCEVYDAGRTQSIPVCVFFSNRIVERGSGVREIVERGSGVREIVERGSGVREFSLREATDMPDSDSTAMPDVLTGAATGGITSIFTTYFTTCYTWHQM